MSTTELSTTHSTRPQAQLNSTIYISASGNKIDSRTNIRPLMYTTDSFVCSQTSCDTTRT